MNNVIDKGRFIAFVGPIGCGKTLAAVACIKNYKENNPEVKILSTLKMRYIRHGGFRLGEMLSYKDKLIFLDMVESYTSRRLTEGLEDNFVGSIDQLEENKNKLIITICNPDELLPSLQPYLDTIILTKYCRTTDRVLMSIRKKSLDRPVLEYISDASKYFKYYDTLDLPSKELQRIKK